MLIPQKAISQDTVSHQDVPPVLSTPDTIYAHDWVDLGLSVKWATCNIGAASPEDYGDYFAWGETTPKSSYTSDTSKTRNKHIGRPSKY